MCGGPLQVEGAEQSLGVIQDSTDRGEAKVFRARAAPQGVCNNLISALKLLANQQKDGDSPVEMVGTGLSREESAQDDGWAQKVHHGRQL